MSVFIVPPQFQLPPNTPTSGVDCTAYTAAMAFRYAKQNLGGPTGRTIRLLSDEPRPDPGSPGLNLPQVTDVLAEHFGVGLEVYIGSRALSWDEYEAKRKSGRGALVQVSYAPIADSEYDAANGRFRANHCVWDDAQATDDPLADGRRKGIYDRIAKGPRVYDRGVLKRAAGLLDIGGAHAGFGNVWCAFTRDTVPEYRVQIRPRKGNEVRHYRAFTIEDGVITGFKEKQTHGFESPCSIPRAFRWPGKDRDLRYLVQVKPEKGAANRHVGEWVKQHYAEEQ